MRTVILAMLTSTVMAAPAVAQEAGPYAGGGYTFLSLSEEDLDADLGAINARLGIQFNEFFGVETEALLGVKDDEVAVGAGIPGLEVSVGLNYAVGAFGRLQYPVSPGLTVYGRGGFVTAEVQSEAFAEGITTTESNSEAGYGIGAGAELAINPRFGIFADYTRYDIHNAELGATSLGVRMSF